MKRPITAALCLSFAFLAGCGDSGPAPAAPETPRSAWTAAPLVDAVRIGPDGVTVSGRAGPGDRVRLTEAEGAAHGVSADGAGRFEVRLPVSASARLLQATVLRNGEIVPGEGWLFLPPGGDSRAALLRPGAAATRYGEGLIGAIDYDGGAALVSGRAAPGSEVRVTVDGIPAGAVSAGADGAYAVRLPGPQSGPRLIRATVGEATEAVAVDLTNPEGTTLRTTPVDGGWRVTWPLPGGGMQATWIVGE